MRVTALFALSTSCLARDIIVDHIVMDSHQSYRDMVAASPLQEYAWTTTAATAGCDESVGAPLHVASHSGYRLEIYECDEIPKVVILACGFLAQMTSNDGSSVDCCQSLIQDIDRALSQRHERIGEAGNDHSSFYQRQRQQLSFVLKSIEATRVFNEAVDMKKGPWSFVTDFVSTNWQLAWAVAPLVTEGPVKILEIGSFEGRSAQLWSRLLPEGSKLVCVDLWGMDPPHHLAEERFRNNTADLRASGFLVEVIAGEPSNTAMINMAQHQHVRALYPFDVVYIDGSHDAEAVLSDMVMADALLRPGGLMLLDDFEWIGVARAVVSFLSIKGPCCYEITHAVRQIYLRKHTEHEPSHMLKSGELDRKFVPLRNTG